MTIDTHDYYTEFCTLKISSSTRLTLTKTKEFSNSLLKLNPLYLHYSKMSLVCEDTYKNKIVFLIFLYKIVAKYFRTCRTTYTSQMVSVYNTAISV